MPAATSIFVLAEVHEPVAQSQEESTEPCPRRRALFLPRTIEGTFNAFTTYLHFVKEGDFDLMYADLRMVLLDEEIDPMEFRDRILQYIKKIVSEAPADVAQKGLFFNRYCGKLQRTADTLESEFGQFRST
jgi:hypothetical protein